MAKNSGKIALITFFAGSVFFGSVLPDGCKRPEKNNAKSIMGGQAGDTLRRMPLNELNFQNVEKNLSKEFCEWKEGRVAKAKKIAANVREYRKLALVFDSLYSVVPTIRGYDDYAGKMDMVRAKMSKSANIVLRDASILEKQLREGNVEMKEISYCLDRIRDYVQEGGAAPNLRKFVKEIESIPNPHAKMMRRPGLI